MAAIVVRQLEIISRRSVMKKKLSVICLAFIGVMAASEANAKQYEEEELFQSLEEMDQSDEEYEGGSSNGIMKGSYIDEIKKLKSEEAAEDAKMAAITSKNIEMGTINFLKFKEKIGEIFIADDKIADIKMLSDKSFYLSGLEPGATSLVVRNKDGKILADYKVRVTHPLTDVKKAIEEVYPNLDIKMTSMKDNIIVKGTVASPEMAEDVMAIVGKFIEESKIINKLSIETATQVMLKVKIAEVNRDVSKSMGINWRTLSSPNGGISSGLIGMAAGASPDKIAVESGDTVLEGVIDTLLAGENVKGLSGGRWILSAGMNNLAALIDATASENLSTILAEPNLVALSGQSATFKSGGQKLYQITGTNGAANMETKDWGTILEFTPIVLSEDRINIKVKAEVSSVEQTKEGETPGLRTKTVETVVELGSGQSIALAGLLQKTSETSSAETPFLADIPILGSLFRSANPKLSESELVIVVTPYIVKPSSKKLKTPVDMVPKLLSPFKAITKRSYTSINNNKADSAGFSIK